MQANDQHKEKLLGKFERRIIRTSPEEVTHQADVTKHRPDKKMEKENPPDNLGEPLNYIKKIKQ